MIEERYQSKQWVLCLSVFNQAIEDKKEIRTFDIPKMWGLGTEDLKYYLKTINEINFT